MQIWIKQGKESLRLPVLPANFEATPSQQNTSININALGEINLLGKKGLKILPLSSFFPNQEYGFVQYKDFPKPYECVELIESWMDNPVHVTITGTNINGLFTIESFPYSEQDGTGDVYYTIELKAYRKPKIIPPKNKPNKNSTKIQPASTKRTAKTVKTTTYIVKSGDSLYSIARKLTGDGTNCYAIANQNNISNPNLIKAGQKLVIKV